MRTESTQDRLGFGLLGGLSLAALGGCTLLLALVVARGAVAIVHADPRLMAALLGTLALICGTAALVVLPGVLVAAWLADPGVTGPLPRAVRLACRSWAGLPPVLAGVAAYVLAGPALGFGAGVLALGLAALPRVVCAAEARLREVPSEAREAALALGASRWQALLDGVLPAAVPGLGAALGRVMARTAGETAPLIIAWGGLSLSAATITTPDSPLALPYHLFSLALGSSVGASKGAVDAAALMLLTVTVFLGVVPALLLERREERKLW